MNNFSLIPSVLAQTPQPAAPAGPQGMLGMFVPMAVVFAIFYFLILRPQKKRDQQHQALVTALQKGDEVVTQSGVFGKIAGITDKVITLEIAQNVKIKVLKTTVLQKVDANFLQASTPTTNP